MEHVWRICEISCLVSFEYCLVLQENIKHRHVLMSEFNTLWLCSFIIVAMSHNSNASKMWMSVCWSSYYCCLDTRATKGLRLRHAWNHAAEHTINERRHETSPLWYTIQCCCLAANHMLLLQMNMVMHLLNYWRISHLKYMFRILGNKDP